MSRTRWIAGGALVLTTAVVVWALTRSEVSDATPEQPLAAARPAEPPPPSWAPVREPRFSPPVEQVVRVDGRAERFVERDYDPPLELPSWETPPPLPTLDSPERAMASLSSAVQGGDYAWWRTLWDAAGLRLHDEVKAQQGRTEADYVRDWKTVLAGHTLVLTRRRDLPGYAIVYLRRRSSAPDADEGYIPVALARQPDGTWRFTNDLAAHPAFGTELIRHGAVVETVGDAPRRNP